MNDKGLSVRRRTFGSRCASGMGFCCRSDGGLGSEDKGTGVEAPCVGAKRGLGLCWSREVASDIKLGAQNFEMLF